MSNSFSGTSPQPSDFVSQLSAMQSSGAQLGTSIANNAEAGATTASNIGLQQAQTGLVSQQAQGQQLANMQGAFKFQMMQQASQYAQNELQQMTVDAGAPVGSDNSQVDAATASTPSASAVAPSAAAASLGAQPTPAPSAAGTPPGGSAPVTTTAPATGQPLTENNLGIDAGHIRLAVANRFMVPQYTAQEADQIAHARAADMAYGIAGIQTNIAGTLDAKRQQRIAQQTNDSQQTASKEYELYTGAVVNAPAGTALQSLARTGPGGAQLAQKIEALAKSQGKNASWMDTEARNISSEAANYMYHFTGRPMTVGTDNIRYDDTGQPVAGTPRVGINPNTVVQAAGRSANAGAQMVNVPDGKGGTTQVPLWQANGYPSLEAFKGAAGIPQTPGMPPSAQPTGTTMPGATMPTAAPPGSIPGIVTQQNSQLTPAQVRQLQPVAAKYGTDPQTLHTSLTDSSYRLNLPQATPGSTLSPDQQQIRTDYAGHVKEEQDDASEEIDGAAQSLQYLKAAQQLIASHGTASIGLVGGIAANITRLFGAPDATNYQEIAKYLGNAALQNARTTYGSRMTQTEVKLQKDELSPSASMTAPAVNNLLGEMSRIAQYTVDRGQRLRPYLAAGNDARYFDQWNQAYYPRQSIVNTVGGSAQQPAATGSAAPMRVQTVQQALALPKGTIFIDPNGHQRVR